MYITPRPNAVFFHNLRSGPWIVLMKSEVMQIRDLWNIIVIFYSNLYDFRSTVYMALRWPAEPGYGDSRRTTELGRVRAIPSSDGKSRTASGDSRRTTELGRVEWVKSVVRAIPSSELGRVECLHTVKSVGERPVLANLYIRSNCVYIGFP
jgi:hypothetical protein